MAAVPVEVAEAEVEPEQELHPVEGAGTPPEPGYVRVWWIGEGNSLHFLDAACYPDLTFRDLRVHIAETKSFPLLGFTLSDIDGVLYPLDDHPEEGQKIMVAFGPTSPANSFGPYITNRSMTALRTTDCLLPAVLLGSTHVLTTCPLEVVSFRRNASLLNGPSPSPVRIVRNMWINEGPGALYRGTAAILVHYLVTSVVTQLPKAFLPIPIPFWLSIIFRTAPSVSFLLAAPLHRAMILPMPKAPFLPQFFYLPPNALTSISFPSIAPYVVTRELVSSIWAELLEDNRPLGQWLEKRGYNLTGPVVRVAHTALRVLLTQPLVITERYALFTGLSYSEALQDLYQRRLLFTVSNYMDGILSELWIETLRAFIVEWPLTLMSWRINRYLFYTDPIVIRLRNARLSSIPCDESAFFAMSIGSELRRIELTR